MSKFLKISLLMFAISFMGNSVFASDNVLQAIQVDGVKDSYNIILKSDDVAEVRKTIQAPNKMVLDLKGIRASKAINTIYNNTANVDSVVVEPTSDDTVKILIQAQNVANSEVHFDSLKTPLGVLGNSQTSKKADSEVVLSDPMATYSPVYDNSDEEDESGFSLSDATSSMAGLAKNALNNEKLSWLVACALFAMIVMGGLKSIKGKDNEIKVGLAQSLKEREIDLYKGLGGLNIELPDPMTLGKQAQNQSVAGANYGLRAYQDGTRSPYTTSEIQRPRMTPRPQMAPQPVKSAALNSSFKRPVAQNSAMQSTIQRPVTGRTQTGAKSKTTNIDSIKFLESMTRIYEKNGRSDLAQGLKTNMKKAKANLA